MYSINEVALDDTTRGWRILFRSEPINGTTKRLSNVEVPGRNGVLGGISAFKSAPTITLVVRGPGSEVETLFSLFEQNGGTGLFSRTDDTDRVAVFELASLSATAVTGFEELVDVTATLRFPTADWRATDLTTSGPTSLSTGVTDLELLDGISADISDAGIFLSGDFGNFELKDMGSGSWLKTVLTWPNVADTGLLYVGATGQAFRATTAAPWTPVTDMSNYVDVSGGGGFRITPTWDTDPSDRVASLQLTTTNQSGVAFSLRAYNAFALRNGDV